MPTTPDINQERLDQLKKLMPDIFTNDGKINPIELQKIAGEDLYEKERYEFKWYGKSEAKRNAFTPTIATLNYDEKRSYNPDNSENLIIEGDNLEVMKLLLKSYREKIKCIYIDPPYNTGKDFVYSDKFAKNKAEYLEETGYTEDGIKMDTNPETSGRYHSDWLSMMFPRLLIARQLLKEDGVIFISIDDHEVHNLRKLCDEVFGADNFVGIFCWKNKYGAGAKTKGFIEVHEYILCFSKQLISNIEANLTEEQKLDYNKKRDSKYSSRGGYVTQPLMTNSMDDRDNLKYNIVYNNEIITPRKQWVWEEKRLLDAIKNDEVVIKKKKDGKYSVRSKIYLKDEKGKYRKAKPITVLIGPFNQEGTKEVERLIGVGIFSFPKPKDLLKYLYSFTINEEESKNDIYLDFFAGSGTTGHAVAELNQEDGGNRKYILVQLPEKTDEKSEAYRNGYKKISDITIERVKRATMQIEEKNSSNMFADQENSNLGFKVFKLGKSNFPHADFAPDDNKTEEENLAAFEAYLKAKQSQLSMNISDDLLTEILLKDGFQLNYSIIKDKRFDKNDVLIAEDIVGRKALVCLDSEIETSTINVLKDIKDERFICLEGALDTTKKVNLKHYMKDRIKSV